MRLRCRMAGRGDSSHYLRVLFFAVSPRHKNEMDEEKQRPPPEVALNNASCLLLNLPEVIISHIVSFSAAPTLRARVICHQLGLTCRLASQLWIERADAMWQTLLEQDYGVTATNDMNRRSSKRLRRSPQDRVRDAHKLIQMHTEIAYYYVAELAQTQNTKGGLSRSKMTRIIEEYGPHLRINSVVSSGGTFLVEVCRSRHVQESTILQCVQELVEQRGALVDVCSSESSSSQLSALCVASARGMPTVVRYLLEQGATPSLRCSGRFRLHTKVSRSIQCRDCTARDFAETMLAAENDAGADQTNLSPLRKCIKLLNGNDRSMHAYSQRLDS